MPTLPKRTTRRSYQPEQPKRAHGNSAYPFYNSTTWRKCSRLARMNRPMCEVFPELPGEVLDHIVPIIVDSNGLPLSIGGAPYDERNHMVMSHAAHNIKRAKESHGFRVDVIKCVNGLIPKRRADVVEAIKKEGAIDRL